MRNRKEVAEILADTKLIEAALAAGVREALIRHMQAGQPVAEWSDGKTVWVAPDEIEERIKALDDEAE